jgi:hypothetical protein
VKPYWEARGITLYCGDAREIVPQIGAEAIITDPVWPNSVFPGVDPEALLADTLAAAMVDRVVVHLGCTSDPRFLRAVPEWFPFLRTCWLEYAQCSYRGRVLYTGDVAYVFGQPPRARKGAMVLPGKVLSTHGEREFARGTGRTANKAVARRRGAYARLPHPCPRHLTHVRWLVKWFGGRSVLDPFAGTGTTGVACLEAGVACALIEVEERYCELAANRLEGAVKEMAA